MGLGCGEGTRGLGSLAPTRSGPLRPRPPPGPWRRPGRARGPGLAGGGVRGRGAGGPRGGPAGEAAAARTARGPLGDQAQALRASEPPQRLPPRARPPCLPRHHCSSPCFPADPFLSKCASRCIYAAAIISPRHVWHRQPGSRSVRVTQARLLLSVVFPVLTTLHPLPHPRLTWRVGNPPEHPPCTRGFGVEGWEGCCGAGRGVAGHLLFPCDA